MSLGLAGQLFVFEIPNWAELSSAWAQLREGCWGRPVLPVSSWAPSLGLKEIKAQRPRVPGAEDADGARVTPGAGRALLHPGQGTELCMFLMEKH